MLSTIKLGSIALTVQCIHTAYGALLIQSVDDIPHGATYDFIVAGAGVGGGVVASRLAENENWKILVIEAGASNRDYFASSVPGLLGQLQNGPADWNYTTTPSPNGIPAQYARARMLGGCSSHNGMVFTRGSKGDWDRWAETVEDDGLKWDNMMPYMLKAERLVRDSEKQTEQGHVDPSIHGENGKLFLTSEFRDHPINDMFLQVTKEIPEEFPFLLDMNDGRPIGISWNLLSVDDHAERSSSATAYVETSNDNLHVLLNTYVTRVLPVGNHKDFRGIEFAANGQSTRKKLIARKEVILSGGSIGSPQILLNSGIGNRTELEAIGIKTLVDNPSVGKNFSDQQYCLGFFNTTLPTTDFDLDTALSEWNATRTGPLVMPGRLKNQIMWIRLPDDAPPFSEYGFSDPSPGPGSPHIEIYSSQISITTPQSDVLVPAPPNFGVPTVQFQIINLHPTSRGSITLASSDPFSHPIIDVNMLSEPVDLAIMREALRRVRRLLLARGFDDSVSESLYPASNLTTDEELDSFTRSALGPFLHPVGSAGMSPRGANWGVVDPDHRVKGINGLRVIDLSVLPNAPSGHTQAPGYALAERASAMIKKAWK